MKAFNRYVAGLVLSGVWAVSANAAIGNIQGIIKEVSKAPAYQDKAAQMIREQIAQKTARSINDIDVSIEQLAMMPAIQPGEKDIEILSIMGLGSQGSQRLDGLFVVDAIVKSNLGIQDKKISGLMKVIGPVVISRKIINSGNTIQAGDVEELRLPWKNFPAGASYTSMDQIIGKRSKVYIPAGGFVHSIILENQEAIKAGEWINLTLVSSGGVMIRSKAISRQPGSIGDSIRVENPDTKKILTGIIVSNQEVEVQL